MSGYDRFRAKLKMEKAKATADADTQTPTPTATASAVAEAPAQSHEGCPSCGGQLRMTQAKHLKDDRGDPLRYRTCPGDCNRITRGDLAAGRRGG